MHLITRTSRSPSSKKWHRHKELTPNVIYEIYNEPNDGKTWDGIRNYSIALIDTIRRYDPDNLIVVGTPNFSSDVVAAAKKSNLSTEIIWK
jgi:hypothetical protein